MMKFIYSHPGNCDTASGIVIVIDVLRAFSTAAYAFEAGASSISLVSGVDEALALKSAHPDWLLMGEEGGLPPAGFDFGNSPSLIRSRNLAGKQLIQRTGAGTPAVKRCAGAETLLAASLVVASATVRYVESFAPHQVTFVSSGGEHNEEDLACAEYLEVLFRGQSPDPAPFIRRVINSRDASFHLDPQRPEFPLSDLDYCTRIDALDFAMPVSQEDGRLVLRPVTITDQP